MRPKSPYTFSTLRYVHDVTTGEFLNVGVALYAPEYRFVSVQCRTAYKRLKDVFPSLDGESFRASMRHIMARFERLQEEAHDQLELSSRSNILDFAYAVLLKDDSSLQWSPAGSGLTNDPEATLEQLYDRLVTRYDVHATAPRRDDDDVWRRFSLALQQRHMLKHFQPKRIAVQDDEIEFEHAWKNGAWHCLAPLSFDLASADSIRDKAHKWLGQLASVRNASEEFQMYFLVGEPSNPDLRPAFDSAISILRKAPMESFIFRESQAEELSERVAAEMSGHSSASAN